MILQQPVEREQMQKLLATGRTDLLAQFVSKRGRRFKAFLVKTPDGKVGFEFQPRAERPPAHGRRGGAPLKAAGEEAANPLRAEEPAPKEPAASSRRAPGRSKATAKSTAKTPRAAAPKTKARRKAA
jgi:DNA topoisomerase-3